MEYISTRNNKETFTFEDVFLKGLAPDGGLFIPKSVKKLTKEEIKSFRNLIFSNTGNFIKTPVYDGNKLSSGHQINGPAVIEEDTTTLVIEPEWFLELHKSGTYIIKLKLN